MIRTLFVGESWLGSCALCGEHTFFPGGQNDENTPADVFGNFSGPASTGLEALHSGYMLSVAYRFVDGFLAIGTANRAYYRTLGIPDQKIFHVPYTVDNERFIVAAALAPEQRAEVREKYDLPVDRPVVLYASKFMCRKHPDDVVRAMARLRDDGLTATLFMVGSGEMEHELRDLTASLDLHNVVFGGFINQAELPKVYAASDIFLLPSSGDQWGLIVNQVIAAALPATARYETGAAPDLVQGKGTGMIYRCGDVVALASALEALLQSEALRREMGERARHLIRAWSVEACALGTVSAVRHLVRA